MRPVTVFLWIVLALAAAIQALALSLGSLDNPLVYTPAAVTALAAIALRIPPDQAQEVLDFLKAPAPKLFIEIAAAVAVVAGIAGLWLEFQERERARIVQAWNVIAQGPGAGGNIGQIKALEKLTAENEDTEGVNLSGGWYPGVDFSAFKLGGARFDSANLQRARFGRKQDLRTASFKDADLTCAVLAEADLQNADFTQGAVLVEAMLSDADLSGARLHDARLGKADLSGATLVEAQLDGANLDGANLSGANLNGARLIPQGSKDCKNPPCPDGTDCPKPVTLIGANLSGAKFRSADLHEANLSGADISGADFSGAKCLNDPKQFQNAFYWTDRKPIGLPDDFEFPKPGDPATRKEWRYQCSSLKDRPEVAQAGAQ